jgi:cysteinyl-tRNA synthetase
VLHEVLDKVPGEAVRFLLMRTHYRSTLDFSDAGLVEARRELDRFYGAIEKFPSLKAADQVPLSVMEPLCDDLNTPRAISALHELADAAYAHDEHGASALLAAGKVLGLFNVSPQEWFLGGFDQSRLDDLSLQRSEARLRKDYAEADRLKREIERLGVKVLDGPGGVTTYRLA